MAQPAGVSTGSSVDLTGGRPPTWLRARPLLQLWLSIIAGAGVILTLTQGRFTTNDDVLIRSIASGSLGGTPDAHLVFVNVVLGGPLSVLYRIVPVVPWYALLLNGAVVVAVGGLGWAVLRTVEKPDLLVLAVVLSVGLSIGVVLQTFTASAIVATAAGMAMHRLSLRHSGSLRLDVAALLLVLLGVALRFDGALLGLAIGETAILTGERRWASRQHIKFVIAVGVAAFALRGIDLLAYRLDEKWQLFWQFNNQRARLHTTPRLDSSPKLTAARMRAGWSDNDLALFSRWLYADRATFSTAALRTIVEGTEGLSSGRSWVTALNDDIVKPYQRWLACIMATVLASCAWKWRAVVALVATLCLWAAVGIYLVLFQRFPERVALPTLAAALIVLGPVSFGFSRPRRWTSVMLILPLAQIIGLVNDGSARAAADARRLSNQLEAMARLGDQATFVFVGSAVDLEGLSSLTADPSRPARSVVLSWPNLSPPSDRELWRLGIVDPILAAAQRPDVYLVVPAGSSTEFVTYLNGWLVERSYRGPPLKVQSEMAGLAFLS